MHIITFVFSYEKKNHLIKFLSSLIVRFSGLDSLPGVLSNAINWFDGLTVNSAGNVYLMPSISISCPSLELVEVKFLKLLSEREYQFLLVKSFDIRDWSQSM